MNNQLNNSELIRALLLSFKITTADFREIHGKTVTLYKFRPQFGVRVAKIRNLKDELAAALAVHSVRIIAPMPDGSVGIEVPNREREIIPVADMLQSWEYDNTDFQLPLAIGRTVTNDIFIADLAQMPHLLVAGATGQGKSVGLNVMLHSLLSKLSPDELQLILIDPKQVEFSIYSQLAQTYLATPVITEPDQAQCALEKLCTLMDERYTLLSTAGVRNITEYNSLHQNSSSQVSCANSATPKLPYVVCIIDEYGDLVLQAGREMERLICRLAQKARAVGIHLIISTQRPSATIVTGNIKANFPVRIAFRTTTGTDSRVILDQVGAERLTGQGDLLFFAGAETTRVQCAYASLTDVNNLCRDITEKYADHPHTFRLPLSETEKARLIIEQYRREQAEEQQRLERAREEARRKEAERRKYQEEHRDEIIARRNAMRKFFYEDKSPYLSVFFQSRSRLPEQSKDKQ